MHHYCEQKKKQIVKSHASLLRTKRTSSVARSLHKSNLRSSFSNNIDNGPFDKMIIYKRRNDQTFAKSKPFSRDTFKYMPHQDINFSTILLRFFFTDAETPPSCLTSASSIKSLRRSFSLFSSHLDSLT